MLGRSARDMDSRWRETGDTRRSDVCTTTATTMRTTTTSLNRAKSGSTAIASTRSSARVHSARSADLYYIVQWHYNVIKIEVHDELVVFIK